MQVSLPLIVPIKTPAKPLVLIHLTKSKLDAREKGVVPCKLSRLVTEGLLTGTKWVREAKWATERKGRHLWSYNDNGD